MAVLNNKERIRLSKKYKVSKILMNAQPAEDNQGWVNVSSTVYANNIRDTLEEIVFIVDARMGGEMTLQVGDTITIPDKVTEYTVD